jgi:N-acetylglucosaminyldiphosphoundecaprenol N-acetyl-beta-D-mannosaminyltransferase
MSRIFGVRLDHIDSRSQLRDRCIRYLLSDRTVQIFTPNPEILLLAREDPTYRDILMSADLALPDGAGVAMVETLRTGRRVRRWPGIEIGELLVRIAAEYEAKIAFVGGAEGVAERAAAMWRNVLPDVRIEIFGAGTQIAEDGVAYPTKQDAALTSEIANALPAIVLVGLGAPKQERWIARQAPSIPSARIIIGLGGTFDMWTNDRRRSPILLRKMGLEWIWRLALEPRRWRRILRATVMFPIRVLLDGRR